MVNTTGPLRRPTMTLALGPACAQQASGVRSFLDLARGAEAAGVDRILVVDHVVMGDDTSSYPFGRFAMDPAMPWPEPMTVLAAVAAVTERVRLATGILIATLRPAALLAKTVATLDALSGGRVDLGVGLGWQRLEYEAAGVDFDRRGPLLTETIAACRALWRGGPARFSGSLISFEGARCDPLPVQARVPVWFSGGLHAANLRRIVELGDGWLPNPGTPGSDVAQSLPRLHAAWQSGGRPGLPDVQMRVAARKNENQSVDLAATMAEAARLAATGATDIRFDVIDLSPDVSRAQLVLQAARDAFDRAVPTSP